MNKPDPAYLIYRGGRSIASIVPGAFLFGAAQGLGTAVAHANGKRRAVVRRNLARVVGSQDVDRYVDQAFRSYARYWTEALRLPKPGAAEINRRTTVEGLDHMSRYLDAKQGVVVVLPHLGSYDVAGAWVASHGWRTVAVAEQLEPPELFDMFCELRLSVGVEVLPAGKGSTARTLLTALREGAAVGLVSDRDISGSGIDVEFFAETTKIPNGPAVLASRTGSPIVCGALYQRPGGRYHAVILPPIETKGGKASPERIRELTVEIVRRMEELIKREPGQWHLFQPNWPSDPGYRHSSAPDD